MEVYMNFWIHLQHKTVYGREFASPMKKDWNALWAFAFRGNDNFLDNFLEHRLCHFSLQDWLILLTRPWRHNTRLNSVWRFLGVTIQATSDAFMRSQYKETTLCVMRPWGHNTSNHSLCDTLMRSQYKKPLSSWRAHEVTKQATTLCVARPFFATLHFFVNSLYQEIKWPYHWDNKFNFEEPRVLLNLFSGFDLWNGPLVPRLPSTLYLTLNHWWQSVVWNSSSHWWTLISEIWISIDPAWCMLQIPFVRINRT